MANFVVALGANSTSSPLHDTRRDVAVPYVIDKILDFSSTAVVASTYQNNYYTALTSVVSGDTVDVLPIPTKTLVMWAGFEVVRAATANTDGTIALALVAPASTLVAATTVSAAGFALSQVTFIGSSAATAYSGPTATVVSSANGTTARVTVGVSVPDVRIRVFAMIADLSATSVRVN